MSKSHRVAQLQCVQPTQTKHATFEDKNATADATVRATASLKALALKVLGRNRQRNSSATSSSDECNFSCNSRGKSCTQLHTNATKNRAKGYGCGMCGNKIHLTVMTWETYRLPETEPYEFEHRPVTAWMCETCKEVYPVVGGTNNPQLMS